MSVAIDRTDPLKDQDILLPFLVANVNDRMNPDGYRWQFEGIPQPAIFITGQEGGAIVCTQSFLPHGLSVNGAVVPSVKSEHSFLVPAKRGTSVFTDAYALGLDLSADAGARTCWGFTPAVKVWRNRLGFQVFEDDMVETTSMLYRPSVQSVRTLRSAARFLRSYLAYLPFAFKRRETRKDIKWENSLPSDAEITQLFRRVAGPRCIHLHLSVQFKAWRMDTNPNIEYGYLAMRGGSGDLLGFAVIGKDHRDPSTVHLAEAIALDTEWLKALLDKIALEHKAPGRVLRAFANKQDLLFKQLWAALNDRFASTVTVNPGMAFVLKTDMPDATIDRWHIGALWTQGFHR